MVVLSKSSYDLSHNAVFTFNERVSAGSRKDANKKNFEASVNVI